MSVSSDLRLRLVAPLPHWAKGMVKESDDSVLVVALNELLRIHPDGRIVDLGAFAPFSAGVVDSVAFDGGGNIWLGMWHYVVRATADNERLRDVTWLAPDSCHRFDEKCSCVPFGADR